MDKLKEQLGGECVKCGATDQLEFNHKHPQVGDRRITRCWKQKKVIDEEIKKVELLCKECHKENTRQQVRLAWLLFKSLPPELQERWCQTPPDQSHLKTLFGSFAQQAELIL